jgi:hypothetical protein
LEVTSFGTFGGNLLVDKNSLSTLDGGTLFVQPTGGSINFLAGLMTLDETGQIIINGDLSINGNLAANTISNQANQDLTFKLTENAASSPEEASPSAMLAITNNQNQVVASVDASGSAKFNRLIIASDSGEDDPVASTSATIKSNATTGKAVIPAGTTTLTIQSPSVTATSLIYVTPLSSTQNQVIYVRTKRADNTFTPENEAQFTVAIDRSIDQDINFNWWIVGTSPTDTP